MTSLSQPHSSFPAGLCRPCPWNWGLFQGSCYLFSWTQSDWKSAVSACQDIGAQLVIIKSPEEQVGWARFPLGLGHMTGQQRAFCCTPLPSERWRSTG